MEKIIEGRVISGSFGFYTQPCSDIVQQDEDHGFYPYYWFPDDDMNDYLSKFAGKKIRITITIEELKWMNFG